MMALQLKPARGGFLRPFGCGWFIREYLMGNKPDDSPSIDLDAGAPQADVFYYYKNSLRKAIALDRATRAEEKKARREKRSISPDNIETLTEKYLSRIPYKALMAAVPKPGEDPHSIGGIVPDPINLPPGCRFHPRCDSSMEICRRQVPPMREVAPGHFVACHICQGGTGGSSR